MEYEVHQSADHRELFLMVKEVLSDPFQIHTPGIFAVWSEPERSWTVEIGLTISSLILIFGGVVPFIPQYIEISKTKNTVGFSPFVCFAVIVSSSLKIAYWFRIGYDSTILFHSLVMIILMLTMMEIFIRVDAERNRGQMDRNFFDFEIKYFWDWTNILSYIQVTVMLNIIIVFLILCFGWFPGFMETIGGLSLIIDVAIAVPQFMQNWLNNSTQGLNKAMICLWALGDMYKLLYYLIRSIPLPFIIMTTIELLLDLAIVGQIIIYGDAPSTHSHHFRISDLNDASLLEYHNSR